MTCFFTGSAAAVTFDAAKKLDISPAHVSVLLHEVLGVSLGVLVWRPAVNMVGAAVRLAAT